MKHALMPSAVNILQRRGLLARPWCLALVLVAAGCSKYHEDKWSRDWPARVPAGGVVTYLGTPVEKATVVLSIRRDDKNKSYNASGTTDSAGKFVLRTFRPNDGAVVGTHKVQIQKITFSERPKDLPPMADFTPVETSHLPKRYGSPDSSGLTAEVTEKGPNQFIFELNDSPAPAAKPAR